MSIKPVRLVSELGPLAEQLKAINAFRCHVLVPDCREPPYAEVLRIGRGAPKGMRGLYCLKHAKYFAAQGGFKLPEPEDN